VSSACPLHFLFFSLLYSLHHIPLMQPSSSMHLSSCALPPFSRLNPPHDNQPNSSLFIILIVPKLLVHAIFPMPLHAHTMPHLLHISSAFPDHHNSSASLVVPATRSATLGFFSKTPQPLWQLRLLVFSVTVDLMPSVSVTGFNTHPSVNPYNDHLSLLDEA
jgi:hypothetical protein